MRRIRTAGDKNLLIFMLMRLILSIKHVAVMLSGNGRRRINLQQKEGLPAANIMTTRSMKRA
jgi:hypothetical protein